MSKTAEENVVKVDISEMLARIVSEHYDFLQRLANE